MYKRQLLSLLLLYLLQNVLWDEMLFDEQSINARCCFQQLYFSRTTDTFDGGINYCGFNFITSDTVRACGGTAVNVAYKDLSEIFLLPAVYTAAL